MKYFVSVILSVIVTTCSVSAQDSGVPAPIPSLCRFAGYIKSLGKRTDTAKARPPVITPTYPNQPPPFGGPVTGAQAECPLYSSADLQKAAAAVGLQEYQLHVNWSVQDQGYCEPDVQKDVNGLDKTYNTTIYAQCIATTQYGPPPGVTTPSGTVVRGRACVMQYAIAVAKKSAQPKGTLGEAAFAVLLTIATQRHNDGAVKVLTAAGYDVAKYLAKQ